MNNHSTVEHTGSPAFHWIWSGFASVVVVLSVAFRYVMPVRDGDLWFHMLYGEYFLKHKTIIPDHTIYSWSPATNDIIYCTWLPDIFLYLLHKATGLPGLFAFRYACLFFFVLACYLYARKLKVASNPLTWLIILIGVLLSYVAAYLKPEIISYVLMTLLVWNWWHIRTGSESIYRWCYAIPVIMLVWVNSHGGVIFGYIFLSAVTIGEIMNTWWSHGNSLPLKVRKHLWIALGIAVLVLIANPYGWKFPLQLFHGVLSTENTFSYNIISAYSPTFKYVSPAHAYNLYANIAILILAVLYFFNLKKRTIEWSSLISNFIFAVLYTLFLRTTFFFAPVFAFSSILLLGNLKNEISEFSKKFHYGLSALISLILLFISINAIREGYTEPEGLMKAGRFGISFANPVDSANYIKHNFPKSKIGNTYEAGSYLLWTLWPYSKVIFDARYFPYRKWSPEYFDFCRGNNFSYYLKKYPADLWCISHSHVDMYSRFLFSSDWKLAFVGRNASVFIPQNIPFPDGNNHYQVTENIIDVDNINIISYIYLFALKRQAWSLADALLEQIEVTYSQPKYSIHLERCKTVRSGMRSFSENEHEKAITFLNKHPEFFKIEISVSHLEIAQKLIQMSDLSLAGQHIYAAYKSDPNNAYNLYNSALIDWLLQKQYPDNFDDKRIQSYLKRFRLFIQYAGTTNEYKNQADIANDIVNERYQEGLQPLKLIIPKRHR